MDQPPDKYELHAWAEVYMPGFDREVLIQVVADLLIRIMLLWLLQSLNSYCQREGVSLDLLN